MFPLRVVLVTVTKALSTLFRIAFAPQQKSYQTGLLFTHKDDCGGAISVTERCCPAPISLAENIDLSDWCSHYTRIRKAISGTMLACVASVSVRFRSKERGARVKDRARNGVSKRAARAGTFSFWLLFHFSRGQNRDPVPRSFFAPKPNGNACYAG